MESLSTTELTRAAVDNIKGAVLLEFGAAWCGYCQAAQNIINTETRQFANVHHIKIEDGKGRKLGRSFSVKLWPTLIFMRDGVELKRLVRQIDAEELHASLQRITT